MKRSIILGESEAIYPLSDGLTFSEKNSLYSRGDVSQYSGGDVGLSMPIKAPLPMPDQDFSSVAFHQVKLSSGLKRFIYLSFSPARLFDNRLLMYRLLLLVGWLFLVGFATGEVLSLANKGGFSVLEMILCGLFIPLFAWISFSACQSLLGSFVYFQKSRGGSSNPGQKSPSYQLDDSIGKTLILMPIYHEDTIEIASRLEIIAQGLFDAGMAHRFELCIASDTLKGPDSEQEAKTFNLLKKRLLHLMPLHYRRRERNIDKKPGNVRNILENWGNHYTYALVLDADSLMTTEAILRLHNAMDQDPSLGLAQSAPKITYGHSLFSALQCFSSHVYNPVLSYGLSAWSGNDAPFWGHNALIRVSAFTQSCGLSHLKGRKPFCGPILSHDFVEAALLRRNGYKVKILPDIEGSYEEGPQSIADISIRDRRWAQGNLQHSMLLKVKGFSLIHRFHFLIGIASYGMSALWLCFLSLGIVLGLMKTYNLIASDPLFSLSALAGDLDHQRFLALLLLCAILLFLPKIMGFFITLIRSVSSIHQDHSSLWERGFLFVRKVKCGCLLFIGMSIEIVISLLLAPVMMLIHSYHIFDILRGHDSGWKHQNRGLGALDFTQAFVQLKFPFLIGLFLLGLSIILLPSNVLWVLPTLLGLSFSPFLALLLVNQKLGVLFHHRITCQLFEQAEEITLQDYLKGASFKTTQN